MTGRSAALVTGAAGFIGAHLVRRLAAAGGEVRAVDIRPSLPAGARDGGEVGYHRRDIRDTEALRPLLAEVDTVFHLAAAHLSARLPPQAYREVNVEAAERLATLCAEAGVRRLVHASSVGIYGHVARPPADEEAPKRPGNPYESSKLAGERAVLRRGAETGLETVVLRPTWVYGPGCPRTERLLGALRAGRFVYVGDGSNLRHPLHVDDLLEAFLLAAFAPAAAAGRPYVVGGPRYMRLREMVEGFARALGVPPPRLRVPRVLGILLAGAAETGAGAVGREPPISRRSLVFFENDNAFDTSAARAALGFEPAIELEEGVRRTLEASASRAA